MDIVPTYSLPNRNRQVVLARRPNGNPCLADFTRTDGPVPPCEEGKFLVRNLYLSADPVQRGWAADSKLTPLGRPFRAFAVGVVIESRVNGINAGEIVYGPLGWQDYALADREGLFSHIIDPLVPVSAYAGVLGMPGVTAWLALFSLAPPSPGDAVLVSAAAGSVGSVVGQLVQQRGATAIGLAGSAAKVTRCVERYGYEQAFNYKTSDLAQTFAQVAPQGFATFFDNTGGPILDHAIRAMRRHGKLIACGTAGVTSWSPAPTGLRNERDVLMRVLTWSGFSIFDHVPSYPKAIDALSRLILSGDLAYDEEIGCDMAMAPEALIETLAGRNHGKKLVFVGEG